MSKGFFRVFASNVPESESRDTEFACLYEKKFYIAKRLVKHVSVYPNISEFYGGGNFQNISDINIEENIRHEVDDLFWHLKHGQCVCEDKQSLEFQCPIPIYELVASADDDDIEDIIYVAHHTEHENIERFLAGSDDPLFSELVHLLKYAPNFSLGEELRAAKEDFEQQAKKQKTVDSE